MPCQCQNATVANEADTPNGGCECATDSASGCQCGSGAPTPSEGASLEWLVSDPDTRVRKLEAGG